MKKDEFIPPEEQGITGIDPRAQARGEKLTPYNAESFAQIRVIETWKKYADKLTWGKGQCLAVLDDGCDLTVPEWQTEMPWGKKVIATYNSIDCNDDPTPVPPGYHGTTAGFSSSMNFEGVLGVAYNDFVAQVRCVSVVHLRQDESETLARGLQWVAENAEKYNITTVNLSPLDDQPHQEPVPTVADEQLKLLREMNIWVSAPCGNNQYTNGISWPACQLYCFGIGGTQYGKHEAHLDRYKNTDLLVCAFATSSSNAYAASCSMILREAIELTQYQWQNDGDTLPDAMMAIFQRTGVTVDDPGSGCSFQELDLLSAVDYIFESR